MLLGHYSIYFQKNQYANSRKIKKSQLHKTQKRKSTRYLQVLFGDPDENRQGSALTICFANILFYVPFGSAFGEPPKDGRRVRFSVITFWHTKKKKHSLFASAFW